MITLDDTTIRFVLAILVLIVGLGFLFSLFRFGSKIFDYQTKTLADELKHEAMHSFLCKEIRYSRWWADFFQNWYQTYLEKRNDFWEHYGQVALAVLIVVVLAVLLLSKVISAEAGLPILSAVAGFAIAKTSSSSSNNRRSEPPNSNDG